MIGIKNRQVMVRERREWNKMLDGIGSQVPQQGAVLEKKRKRKEEEEEQTNSNKTKT
jgi:hypothetical protein